MKTVFGQYPWRRKAVALAGATLTAAVLAAGCSSTASPSAGSGTTESPSGSATAAASTGSASGTATTTAGESGQTGQPAAFKDGGTMTVGLMATSLGPLDPVLSTTLASSNVLLTMCESLYSATAGKSTLDPILATDQPKYSSDRTSAEISLRDGVTFQDGTTFDAAAVKASIDRGMTLKGSLRLGDLAQVKSVDVVDPHTVRFNFKAPLTDGAFLNLFTSRALYPVSPTAVQKEGSSFANNPVCVGPYKLAAQTSDSATLKRDSHYYNPSSVHLDTIVFKLVSDGSVRLANLLSGTFNVIQAPSPKDADSIKSNNQLTLFNVPGIGYQNLSFNAKGALNNPLARRAVEEAIDRQAISQAVWAGKYPVACTGMPPENPLATPEDTACLPYDVDQAKKDMAASGLKTPVAVKLVYAQSPEYQQTAAMIQQFVAQIGINVTLAPSDTQTVISQEQAGQYDASLGAYTGTMDPAGDIGVVSNGFANYTNWDASQLDPVVDEINRTNDPTTLKSLYGQVTQILHDQAPTIYLVRPANLQAWRANVAGVQVTPSSSMGFLHAGFTS